MSRHGKDYVQLPGSLTEVSGRVVSWRHRGDLQLHCRQRDRRPMHAQQGKGSLYSRGTAAARYVK